MTKIRANEIIIKPADKGSIVVVMTPEFYWKMCQSHLNNEQYYRYYSITRSFIDYK